MDISDLKKIGLTQGEIRIYEALLKLGETTRTELAKTSGISPSKIYDVANRLIEKGIISSVKKNGVLHFSAANPERIKDFLETKEKEIQNEKQLVSGMMPSLMEWYQKTDEEVDIEVFYGWEGMKTVYNDIVKTLKKGDENYVFGASIGENTQQSDYFFSQYTKKAEEKGYRINIIFNEELRKYKPRTNYFVNSNKHRVKFHNQETLTELNLYKDTVLIVMLLKKPIVVRIKNEEAYDSFKQYFDSMWKISKK